MIELLSGSGLHLSIITRMELLSYPGLSKANTGAINAFLEAWPVEDLHSRIEHEAIRLRRQYKLKLPDSIIAATASHVDLPLITADKDMLRLEEEIEVIRYVPEVK